LTDFLFFNWKNFPKTQMNIILHCLSHLRFMPYFSSAINLIYIRDTFARFHRNACCLGWWNFLVF
jgi:hypothetical protein